MLNTAGTDADAALALLKVILADTVRLPHASCVGRHEMFDPILGNGRQYQAQEQIRLATARVGAGAQPERSAPRCTAKFRMGSHLDTTTARHASPRAVMFTPAQIGYRAGQPFP